MMLRETMDEPEVQSPLSSQNPLQPVLDLLQGGEPEVICRMYGITREELEKRLEAYQNSRRQAVLAEQLSGKRAGRNEPCPCGSGKKFKKCCHPKYEEARKNLPQHQLQDLEVRTRAREQLEEDVKTGFDLLFFFRIFQRLRCWRDVF
jgi:hypothetical protein